MYSVLVKCLIFSIFTLIFDFYLFFGQRTVGKGLTIAKDMMLHPLLNSQKRTLFKNIKFDPRAIKKKSSK
jgi:hypothetical protein